MEDTVLAFYNRLQIYYDAMTRALLQFRQAVYDRIVVPFAEALSRFTGLQGAGLIRRSKQTRHFLAVKCRRQIQRAKVARRIEQRGMKRMARALARREFYVHGA